MTYNIIVKRHNFVSIYIVKPQKPILIYLILARKAVAEVEDRIKNGKVAPGGAVSEAELAAKAEAECQACHAVSAKTKPTGRPAAASSCFKSNELKL